MGIEIVENQHHFLCVLVMDIEHLLHEISPILPGPLASHLGEAVA
ncbi:hypothetical protein KSF_088540 [Reticulibacter mediterranei]|uniref:Uncharacterized protein n=1 Tax=Reticulibacter mediterranei TaxID=2778369 RepID=A0A8J3IZE5_9CHLR|nr:hypothetical protein [Reticulibacter mediterranei]GHO98806.1 hypothetical protein KSF_088540 [Reticulibacter mediterranei]